MASRDSPTVPLKERRLGSADADAGDDFVDAGARAWFDGQWTWIIPSAAGVPSRQVLTDGDGITESGERIENPRLVRVDSELAGTFCETLTSGDMLSCWQLGTCKI